MWGGDIFFGRKLNFKDFFGWDVQTPDLGINSLLLVSCFMQFNVGSCLVNI
jgi:hypothetical protein